MQESFPLISRRSLAACIADGCRLVANNIWTLLYCSWPLLVLWLPFAALMFSPVDGFWSIIAIVASTALELLWIYHTAMLLRLYNIRGIFLREKATAIWRADGGRTGRSLMRQLWQLIRSPRQWPAFVGLLFVCAIYISVGYMLLAMPLGVTALMDSQIAEAYANADPIDIPAYMLWLRPIVAAVAKVLVTILSWAAWFPLAFFSGSIYAATPQLKA